MRVRRDRVRGRPYVNPFPPRGTVIVGWMNEEWTEEGGVRSEEFD